MAKKGALRKGSEGTAAVTGAEQKQRQPHGEHSSPLLLQMGSYTIQSNGSWIPYLQLLINHVKITRLYGGC